MQRVIFFNLIILFIFQQYIDNQQCDMEMLAPRENSRSLYCEFAILKNNSTLCLPPSVPPIYNWAYPKLSHRSERISSDVTFNHSVFLWNLWVAKILFICQLYYLRCPTSCTAIIASLQRQKQKQVEAAVKPLPRCWCQYPLPFFRMPTSDAAQSDQLPDLHSGWPMPRPHLLCLPWPGLHSVVHNSLGNPWPLRIQAVCWTRVLVYKCNVVWIRLGSW